ncbi:helix-turn-helix domain-containing protein [Burkholderia ubonensis]|nr:helix-turn-helix transcriptional regulator [Burkholderia ubonensis]
MHFALETAEKFSCAKWIVNIRVENGCPSPWIWHMEFSQRLRNLRKARGLTQLALADAVGIGVLQIRRYEGGSAYPSLNGVRRLAITLGVSANAIVFDDDEREPDDALRYQFEAISRMPERVRELARELLDALIVRNQVAEKRKGKQ